MLLHPLEEREHGVRGGQPLVRGRLGQMVANDAEGEGHALQRGDGVLVGDVVTGEDDADAGRSEHA